MHADDLIPMLQPWEEEPVDNFDAWAHLELED